MSPNSHCYAAVFRRSDETAHGMLFAVIKRFSARCGDCKLIPGVISSVDDSESTFRLRYYVVVCQGAGIQLICECVPACSDDLLRSGHRVCRALALCEAVARHDHFITCQWIAVVFTGRCSRCKSDVSRLDRESSRYRCDTELVCHDIAFIVTHRWRTRYIDLIRACILCSISGLNVGHCVSVVIHLEAQRFESGYRLVRAVVFLRKAVRP